jgi:hypothetical protein
MSLLLSERELAELEPAEKAAFHSPVPTQIVSNGEFLLARCARLSGHAVCLRRHQGRNRHVGQAFRRRTRPEGYPRQCGCSRRLRRMT